MYFTPEYSPKNTENRRNGYGNKTLKSTYGDIPVDVPRDREATFEPQSIPKHQTCIPDGPSFQREFLLFSDFSCHPPDSCRLLVNSFICDSVYVFLPLLSIIIFVIYNIIFRLFLFKAYIILIYINILLIGVLQQTGGFYGAE